MANILVVDDEPNISEMLARALKPHGYKVDCADGGLAAIERINKQDYDLVITDVIMPHADGFAVLDAATRRPAPPDVIIITGLGTIDSAVEAMKRGSAEYITKPLDIPKLTETVRNILRARKQRANSPAEPDGADAGDFAGMVGRSSPMKRLYELIKHVAQTTSTVIIYGENGTGKELVARAVHTNSQRREGPFVAVGCGSLVETLLESELFGHVKGAFTGAIDDKTGLFEAANGGTIFLDEIAETTAGVQRKLLRTLQERAVRPLGSTAPRKIDVRLVSATNRDLPKLVAQNKFRQDLYYRLNVVPIPVPTLSERREDIPRLAEHFAQKYARRTQEHSPKISQTVLAMLAKADWPGNVRQLENVIECAVTFAEGDEVRPEHLPPDFIESFALTGDARHKTAAETSGAQPLRAADITPLGAAIRYLERQMLSKALDASNGNREQAANMLGIDRATLYRKLKAHRLTNGR